MLERRGYRSLHISRLQLKRWSSYLATAFAILSFVFISGGIWLLENNRIESEIIGRRYYYEEGVLFVIIGILLLLSLVCQAFMIHLLFVAKKPWRFTEVKLIWSIKEQTEEALISLYGFEPDFTSAWDHLQSQSECCGFSGPQIYASSKWKYSQPNSSTFISLVPDSCLTLKSLEEQVLEDIKTKSDYEEPRQVTFQKGCAEFLYTHIEGVLSGSFIVPVISLVIVRKLFICYYEY
uniref:Tetraspanin n=1 Tax=Schistosoma haematobium TaxID=6185 RepID=A0A094ZGI0_SCHHA